MDVVHAILSALLAAALSGAAHADDYEMWVQDWGLQDAAGLFDHDPARGHMLAEYHDSAILWDVNTGLALRQFSPTGAPTSRVVDACFLGKDSILLGGTHSIFWMTRQNGRTRHTFDLEGGYLTAMTIDRAQSLLAAGTTDGLLRIWDLESGRQQQVIHADRVLTEMVFSPDGHLLLAGSDERVAMIWEVASGRLHDRIHAPTEVQHVAFSEDGQRLLTVGSGEYWYTPRVVVWDAKRLVPLQIIPRTVLDASFVGDSVRVVLPDGHVEIWPPDRHERPLSPAEWERNSPNQRSLVGITRNHWVLKSSPDATRMSLISPDETEAAGLWIRPDTPQFTTTDHIPLAVSDDGRWLLTGGGSSGAPSSRSAIWNLREGRVQAELDGVQLGEFHPAGDEVVILRRLQIDVLKTSTGETIRSIGAEHPELGPATSFQFVSGGQQLLTAHGDWSDGDGGAVMLWDFATGRLIRDFAKDNKAVMLASMTADGRQIVAALTPGYDGSAWVDQLSVIDAATGDWRATRMFSPFNFQSGPVSPATSRVAGYVRKVVNVEDAQTPRSTLFSMSDLSPQTELPPTSRPVVFSRDGQVIGCIEGEQRLAFYDARSGAWLHNWTTRFQSVRPIVFHPGQQRICGALHDPWNIHEFASNGTGFEDVLTGELVARLTLFREDGSWLVVTHTGHINGSDAGLQRVTWRRPGTTDVIRDEQRTQRVVNPATVAQVLSQSLPGGDSLRDRLQRAAAQSSGQPQDEPIAVSDDTSGRQWFKEYYNLQQRANQAFQSAGADLEINSMDRVTRVRLEKRTVDDDLLWHLRWAFAIDRLDLAETGITDEQLDEVGLVSNLKRLSLWGNPITDKGLYQLAGLWHLEVLDIHGTQVTAEGLNALRMLPQLKKLVVPDSIALADLEPLRASRPDLEIIVRGE